MSLFTDGPAHSPIDDPFVVGDGSSINDESPSKGESPARKNSTPSAFLAQCDASRMIPLRPKYEGLSGSHTSTPPASKSKSATSLRIPADANTETRTKDDFTYPEPEWLRPPESLAELSYPNLEAREDLLHRLILYILNFTYDARVKVSFDAPAPTSTVSPINASKAGSSVTTFRLTPKELELAKYLAHSVVYCINIQRCRRYNIYNPVPKQPLDWEVENALQSNYAVIHAYLVLPCKAPNIPAEWVIEQFYAYYTHQCQEGNERQTMLHHHDATNETLMAKRLITDGLVVQRMQKFTTKDEGLRKMGRRDVSLDEVGRKVAFAVEMFGEKAMGDGRAVFESVERKIWVGVSAKRLNKAMWQMGY